MSSGRLHREPIDKFLGSDETRTGLDAAIAKRTFLVELLKEDEIVEDQVLAGEISPAIGGTSRHEVS